MTAPTVAYIEASQANTASSIPATTTVTAPAVGDLAIVWQTGVSTSTGTLTAPFYASDGLTNAGADAGYTSTTSQASSATGHQIAVYHKVLTSTDFNGSNQLRQLVPKWAHWSTPNRVTLFVFHHASGWDSTVFNTVKSSANTGNGTFLSLTDSSRASVAVAGISVSSATQLHIGWDNGTDNVEPYCDASSTTQTDGASGHHYGYNTLQNDAVDFKLYNSTDTTTNYTWDGGLANTTHATVAVQFQVAVTTVTGTASLSGGGTFTASGTPTVTGTASVTGGGTFTASGTPTVKGTASVTGGGVLHAQQQGAVGGTAALAGGGVFAARQAVRGTASISGGGTFAARQAKIGVASLTSDVPFRAAGIVGIIAAGRSGTWEYGALTQPADTWTNATGAAAGGGTFAATGRRAPSGSGIAIFVGGDIASASGVVTVVGTAELIGGGDLEAAQRFVGIPITLDRKTTVTIDRLSTLTLDGD